MAIESTAPANAGPPAQLVSSACALCGSSACIPLFTKDHAPFFECTNCSFRFAIPDRNANLENKIDEFETSYLQYFREAPRDKVNFDNLLAWISKYCDPRRGSMLDVGCGSGKFTRYLRKAGLDAYGIEPSAALYEHFLSKENYFYQGTLQSRSGELNKKFRVITAFDVIEHVNEPLRTVALIADLVEPGGWAFMSTPDVGCAHARLMGKRWHYYHRYHLSYWSRATLEKAAAQYGLQCRYFGWRSRYQTFGYVMSYFWEHILERKSPAIFSRAEGLAFPINLFDVMYLGFEKRK